MLGRRINYLEWMLSRACSVCPGNAPGGGISGISGCGRAMCGEETTLRRVSVLGLGRAAELRDGLWPAGVQHVAASMLGQGARGDTCWGQGETGKQGLLGTDKMPREDLSTLATCFTHGVRLVFQQCRATTTVVGASPTPYTDCCGASPARCPAGSARTPRRPSLGPGQGRGRERCFRV